jgi:hypothetical protein
VDASKTSWPPAVLGRMAMGKVGRLEAVGKSSRHEFVVWTRWAQCQGAFVVKKSPGPFCKPVVEETVNNLLC